MITVFTVECRACALTRYTPGFGATVVHAFPTAVARDAYSIAHDRLKHPSTCRAVDLNLDPEASWTP